MEFLKCTIGGISYGSGETEIDRVNKARREGLDIQELEPTPSQIKAKVFSFMVSIFKNIKALSICIPRRLFLG
jgi:hypothetical protein